MEASCTGFGASRFEVLGVGFRGLGFRGCLPFFCAGLLGPRFVSVLVDEHVAFNLLETDHASRGTRILCLSHRLCRHASQNFTCTHT